MKTSIISVLIALIALPLSAQKWSYPSAPKKPVYDTIWGKVIKDDYRWMEDVKDPEFVNWLSVQNKLTTDVMDKIPNQDKIFKSLKDGFFEIGTMYNRITGNDSYAVYNKLNPGENMSKTYFRDKKSGNEKLLFDPEKYIEGKVHRISDFTLSDDGNYAVFSISEAGKESGKIRLYDMKTLKMLPDEISGRFAGFTKINGVQYISYQSVNSDDVHGDNFYGGQLRLHVPGLPVESDITIASAAGNPELHYNEELSIMMQIPYDDPQNFYMYVLDENPASSVFYKPKTGLFNKNTAWKSVVNLQEKIFSVHLSEGYFYFLTTRNSPFYEFSRKKADASTAAATLYSPPAGWKISNLSKAKDYFVIQITKNGLESRNIRYHTKTGKTEELKFPLNGIIRVTPLGSDTNDATVMASSWTDFSSTYSYNLDKKKLEKGWFYSENKIPENKFLTVEEVEIPSHDGVMVPLSLVYDNRFLRKDGSNICFMYGYGSFGTSISPQMKYPAYLYELGVILAVPHVRGGG